MLLVPRAHARDLGQWDNVDSAVKQWYATLMQPDNPTVSCCGEGDAYWADVVEVGSNKEMIAVITDDRADEPLERIHEDVGTRYVVPPNKISRKDGNPTGHVILFLGGAIRDADGNRMLPRAGLCYVLNGGV